jgi:hypothetical protein
MALPMLPNVFSNFIFILFLKLCHIRGHHQVTSNLNTSNASVEIKIKRCLPSVNPLSSMWAGLIVGRIWQKRWGYTSEI